MLSKMNAKLENQFAAFFAVGSVFPFLRDSNFSILGKVLFFAQSSAHQKQGGIVPCCL